MAPHDPGGSSSINRDGKSFFEVLPRELRDCIYEHTFDNDMKDHCYRYRFRAPQPHLRLVSRQFMHEYDEQAPHDTALFVTGRNDRLICIPYGLLGDSAPPRLAGRCTSACTVQNIGETDVFQEDIDNEKDRVLRSLDERINDFCDFIESFPSLQQVDIQFNLNFVQSFDIVYERMTDFLDAFRHENGESYLSPNVLVEVRHLNLNFPFLPVSLTSGVQDFDALKYPATLATFYYSHGCEEETTMYEVEIEQSGEVEAALLAAWKSQHECSLIEAARKAAGIRANISRGRPLRLRRPKGSARN